MSAALNSELQPVLTLAADSSAQQRQVDDRVYRMCFYQLELLSKKQRRTRNEWTPLRVFGGRQLAHIAYETASRIVVGHRIAGYEEIGRLLTALTTTLF